VRPSAHKQLLIQALDFHDTLYEECNFMKEVGGAIAQAVSCQIPTASFDLISGHVGFVVDKVALGRVSSMYFGFLRQFSFHKLLHVH
jgi:hypothetical protein